MGVLCRLNACAILGTIVISLTRAEKCSCFPLYCYCLHRGDFVLFLIRLKKLLPSWLIGLITLLMILSACGPSRNLSYPASGTSPTPGTLPVPTPTREDTPSQIDPELR